MGTSDSGIGGKYQGFESGFSYLCGLSDLSPRAISYMTRPHMYTSDEFDRYYADTVGMLKELMNADDEWDVYLIPGPIRIAMDATFTTLIEPGDKCLVAENGYWGRYPEYIIKHYGGTPVMLREPEEMPIPPDRVREVLATERGIKAVNVMHVETETGIHNDIAAIGEVVAEHGSLYLVDVATSFGGMPVDVKKWRADLLYGGSHKGLNSPSGLSFVALGPRIKELMNRRTTPYGAWYTNLEVWRKIWEDREPDMEHCPISFPTPILHAMRAKLDYMFEHGVDRIYRKYQIAALALRTGMLAMGLSVAADCDSCPACDSPEKYCSDVDCAVLFPPNVDGVEFGEVMRNFYGITVHHASFGVGVKYFHADVSFRMGTIADYQHIPRNIMSLLSCTGLCLQRMGAKIGSNRIERALLAADRVLSEMETIKYKATDSWLER